MQTSKYRLRTSPMYRTRENSREMSRERLLYREDSYGSERLLRERGRNQTLRFALSERNERKQEKRRERSVSEDYRDYKDYRDVRREKRSKRSESREIKNQEGD